MTGSAGRPPILFPLFAGLETLEGVGEKTARHFAQMGVERPRDLLFTLPYAVVDRRLRPTLRDATLPGIATVEVTVGGHLPPARKGGPTRVLVRDSALDFQLVFFHARGDSLQKQLPVGQRRVVSGKVEIFDGMAQMVHPDHILRPEEAARLPEWEPVYPLTAGVTQRLVAKAAQGALLRAPELEEWADPALVAREGWPRWHGAIEAAHSPRGMDDLGAFAPARRRLAYDELFAHQLTLALARLRLRRGKGRATEGNGTLQARVLATLPYAPTAAQVRAVTEISADMASERRMNRLLQGDVGAGKTLVAFLALLIAVEAGGQGVMMAPTEILARQHLESLRPLAEAARVPLEILTGRDKGAERAAKLAALQRGEIKILVGTHAVFQKDVEFHDLRLAVVDEQHRFGVEQRMELGSKGVAADVLVMTATPIPRSLALAQFGDMDVSVLDEKPAGRKPVRTALVSSGRMAEVVAHLKQAIAEGRQAYWVCPLVAESEVVDLTAAEDRFRVLRAELGEGIVGLVHGQMPPADKDAAMADFVAGKTRLLVATTVIEVGVNVPNASIMVIERAETFGLAQLHQLRGRVGRGDKASTCLLLRGNGLSETARARLALMRESNDGFLIAEEDLRLRGAGDYLGTRQSGEQSSRLATPEDVSELIDMARDDARLLVERDGGLGSERGQAARLCLYLFERDAAVGLLKGG